MSFEKQGTAIAGGSHGVQRPSVPTISEESISNKTMTDNAVVTPATPAVPTAGLAT